MPQGTWKADVKDMQFERYPQMVKEGTQTFTFEDEGNEVDSKNTGFGENSVVFVVNQNGEKKELWFSKMHPILRELIAKGDLKGHKVSIEFTGKGLQSRTTIKSYQ